MPTATNTSALNAIAFGGGTFAAVGSGGSILSSTDGATWTRRSSGTGDALMCVLYASGQFVAGGGFGSNFDRESRSVILTSADGATWAKRVSAWPLPVTGIAYGNGRWVAAESDLRGAFMGTGAFTYSHDGANWLAPYSPRYLNSVTLGNNVVVAVGSPGLIMTSTNGGTTWVEPECPVSVSLNKVAFGNGTFVAVGNYGTVLTSTNGFKWTEQPRVTDFHFVALLFAEGAFAAFGAKPTYLSANNLALTSSNGADWTVTQTFIGSNPVDMVYGNGMYIGAGRIFTAHTAYSGSANYLLHSTDGLSWTRDDLGLRARTDPFFVRVRFGNGLFVVGVNNYSSSVGTVSIFTSSDGFALQQRWTGPDSLNGFAFGNGTFVALAGGYVVISEDGLNWRPQNIGPLVALIDAVFVQDRFVAVGSGGAILVSPQDLRPGINTPPLISTIADQVITNAQTGPITFAITDVETPAFYLTVTGNSTNQGLVANSNIVMGGSGTNRTVTVTALPNQAGTTLIELTVSDGSSSNKTSFRLTVKDVPPAISRLADQTTPVGVTVGPLEFTIGDTEIPAANLTVTGVSTNQALVPNANIVFGGTGVNRTISVTPLRDRDGTTRIDLTVSNGRLSTTTSFFLAVTKAPLLISLLPDLVKMPGETIAPINFTISGVEASGTLSVTASSSNALLLPDANLSLGGSGTNRILILTPVAGRTGLATITVRVAEGGGRLAARSFQLTVGSMAGPRTLRIADGKGAPGGTAAVPVELMSQGDENALGFSLNFDPAVLTFTGATLGTGASGGMLIVNSSQASNGRIGLVLALGSDQGFDAGTRQVVVAQFTIASNASVASTALAFGDQPVSREIASARAQSLATQYSGGLVAVTGGGVANSFRLEMIGRQAGGEVRLRLVGEAGLRYRIEASEDFATWQPVTMVTLSGDRLELLEATKVDSVPRFYRAALVP